MIKLSKRVKLKGKIEGKNRKIREKFDQNIANQAMIYLDSIENYWKMAEI